MNTNLLNNMKDGEHVFIEDMTYVVKTGETFSVCDNGEEIADCSLNTAARIIIENVLTDDDIEAWHGGELTGHVEYLMNQLGVSELQIWGSREGREPLSVFVK